MIPIAGVFAAGMLFARRKILFAADSRVLSEFAFRVAIPAYLAAKLYTADLRQTFDPRSLSIYAATAVAAAGLVAAWARLMYRTPLPGIALRIMGGVQVNTAYFAIPVLVLTFGDASPIFPVLLFQVLVLTVVVIAILETAPDTGPGTGGRPTWRRVGTAVGRSLATPVVVACVAAIALNAARVPVPPVALEALNFAGAAASPVALFALGLYLGASGIRWRGRGEENILVLVKCVAFPLLVWAVMAATGVRDPWRGYLVLIAAMPAPQNLFTFAQTYDADVDLAAGVVLKSTVLALLLLPAWRLIAA